MTATVENEREADEQVQRAEAAVRALAALGRAELEKDAAEAERAAKAEADRKAEARRAVLMAIKLAIVQDNSVPTELFPFMRPAGLGDDGACPNGYVTVCVAFPGLAEGDYVAFNVCRSPNPGQWYVKGEWIARVASGGTQAFPTFARAVASALAAGPAIPF